MYLPRDAGRKSTMRFFILPNNELLNLKFDSKNSLFVCLLGKLFSSAFNPSCVFALYSIEGS